MNDWRQTERIEEVFAIEDAVRWNIASMLEELERAGADYLDGISLSYAIVNRLDENPKIHRYAIRPLSLQPIVDALAARTREWFNVDPAKRLAERHKQEMGANVRQLLQAQSERDKAVNALKATVKTLTELKHRRSAVTGEDIDKVIDAMYRQAWGGAA